MAVLLQMLDFFRTFFACLAMKTTVTHLLVWTFQLNRLSKAEEEQWKAENYIQRRFIIGCLFCALRPFAFTSILSTLLMSQPKTFNLIYFISQSAHTGPKRPMWQVFKRTGKAPVTKKFNATLFDKALQGYSWK